jgi:prenyltransferase beta subunit
MQGAQGGKLVKVQRCPATVTPTVKPDNPPFMTQITSWKGMLGTGNHQSFAGLACRPVGRFWLNDLFTLKVVFVCRGAASMKSINKLILFSPLIVTLILSPLFLSIAGVERAFAVTITSETDAAIINAIDYLQSEQNDDGGLRWVDENSSVPTTIRVVLALTAAGFSHERLVSRQGKHPIDFLTHAGPGWIYQQENEQPSLNIARAGQLLTAVSAANHDPYSFGEDDINLIHIIKSHYDPNTGIFGDASPQNVTEQVWALLGLAATYAPIPPEAIDWLVAAQLPDGSWDDGYGSYLDTTPLGLMALIAAGDKSGDDPAVNLALDYIKGNQQPNGGWQTDWDTSTNANTTGIIIQGIVAANQNPSDPSWTGEDTTPIQALLDLQRADGAIGGDFTNAYSTADAILGLAGQPLFDLGHLRIIGRAFEFIFAAQEADGGWGSVGQTIDVILAVAAAGWDPNSIGPDGTSPVAYIAENLESYLENGPDAIGKAILGVVAAGQDPTNFNGTDLVTALQDSYDSQAEAFGSPENTWHQALAILAISAVNSPIPDGAVNTLQDLQQSDGGWEYTTGFGTWPDNTALALQALIAAGLTADDAAVQAGIQYMQSHQLEDGGWGDSSTTAYAIMALNALGIDPLRWQTDSGETPIHNLFSYQNPSGAFIFSQDFPDESLMSTTSAVLAAAGGNYLIQPFVAQKARTAGLVIQTDQGEITTACVSFDGESTSGLALLDASGIPYQVKDSFMHSILEISNPQGGTMYWSYWHWDGREWVFNNTGAGDSRVSPGSIEAWYFTSWEMFPSLPPEFVPDISTICGRPIPKNYAIQPNLHFYDLNPYPNNWAQATIWENGMLEEESLATPQAEIAEQTKPPILPIIIIGITGLVMLVVIIWILTRKK